MIYIPEINTRKTRSAPDSQNLFTLKIVTVRNTAHTHKQLTLCQYLWIVWCLRTVTYRVQFPGELFQLCHAMLVHLIHVSPHYDNRAAPSSKLQVVKEVVLHDREVVV